MVNREPAGWSLSFNLKIRYMLLYVVVVIGGVAALAYFYSRANSDLRQTITYGSSLLGATIAICALLYNAESIRLGNVAKKREAASRFIERWNHPSYVPLRTEARELMLSFETDKSKLVQFLQENVKARSLAVEQLNLFEEIAIAIILNTADEEILNTFFGYLMPRTFFDYKPWIDQHRTDRRAPEYWCNLEMIAKKWRDKHEGTLPES